MLTNTRTTRWALLFLSTTFVGCDDGDGDAPGATQTETDSPTAGSTTAPVATASASESDDSDPSNTATPTSADPSAGGTTSTDETSSDSNADSSGGDTGIPDGVIPGLSDEFDDAATLPDWTRRHEAEGTEAGYSTLDIDTSTAGHLTFVPTTGGWFGDFIGALLFKEVSGNFMVETSVAAVNQDGSGGPPTMGYNSAGVLVRDPASVPGAQNWVVHNVGFQDTIIATEGKTTTNSASILELIEGSNSGRLRICRIGEALILTRRLDDEASFTETHRFTRSFPDTVQVGLTVNGWNSTGSAPNFDREPDLRAEFDYIRFWEIDTEAECLAD